jgi:hypothetical protein
MRNIPVEIAPLEKIVRAIIFPSHFDKKKGTVTYRAFRPKSDDQLSVIRALLGADFCKAKGREIAGKDKTCKGLAVLTAAEIRSVGAKVIDSREIYCGHAHISYGVVIEANEPLSAEADMKVRALFNLAKYYSDPYPDDEGWRGQAF